MLRIAYVLVAMLALAIPAEAQNKHNITQGDTLTELGVQYCQSARFGYEIAKVNGLTNPDRIRAGRTLVIPACPVPSAKIQTLAKRTVPARTESKELEPIVALAVSNGFVEFATATPVEPIVVGTIPQLSLREEPAVVSSSASWLDTPVDYVPAAIAEVLVTKPSPFPMDATSIPFTSVGSLEQPVGYLPTAVADATTTTIHTLIPEEIPFTSSTLSLAIETVFKESLSPGVEEKRTPQLRPTRPREMRGLYYALSMTNKVVSVMDIQSTFHVLKLCPSCEEGNWMMKWIISQGPVAAHLYTQGINFLIDKLAHKLKKDGSKLWWMVYGLNIGAHTGATIWNEKLAFKHANAITPPQQ